MTLKTLILGPFEVNCYLYFDEQTKDGVIIDPGAEEDRIIETVEQIAFAPLAILLTHGHGDHIAAVAAVKEKYDIPLYIGKGEEELLANPSTNVSAFFSQPVVSPPADYLLEDEQLIVFGGITLKVLSTPGHSPAGVCYLDESEGVIFCGDTIFRSSVGRTDFPGCSLEKLIESIQNKILSLPDSIICYPGHGPQTTVGAERINNPFLKGKYLV